MARPSKIDEVVRTREDGTQVTASEQVIERVQLGADMATAAESAGISRSTLHLWRLDGARALARQANGATLDEKEARLAAFSDAVLKAESEAEVNRLAIIQRAATGGAVHTKTTEKRDGAGVLLESTVVTETLAPQWTAAAWWLERKRGYIKRYELTGAEGAPLVPQPEQARNLADSLRDFLAGAEASGAADQAAKRVRASRKKAAPKADA